MVCAPCLAAAGPPGIAAAAVGTVGYGAYKYISPQKKIKRGKKRTKRKSKKGKKGGGKQDKFKKGEIVHFVTNNGKKQKMKFVKNVPPNKISIKFPNAKKYNPILTVNGDKIEKVGLGFFHSFICFENLNFFFQKSKITYLNSINHVTRTHLFLMTIISYLMSKD